MQTADPLPGLPPGMVFLTEPSPLWPALFTREADRLAAALGSRVLAIEHYGSTSIPGIRAKPVIDLLVGLASLDDALDCIPQMEALGYDFAAHAGVPDHHVFGLGAARTHLAHFVEFEGSAWHECLRFRDRLRADPALAGAYEALKINLSECFPEARADYTAGKSAFVSEVLSR
jgi:GrpB-like predicted nucleotidyltransferase (UPF0157 family)